MSLQKPSHNEDEFIARQEALLKHKLAVLKMRQLAREERERQKREHWMKCPKCGMDLETVVFRGVNIDKCYHCGGTWLDAGELAMLAGRGADVLTRVVEVFEPGPGEVGPEVG